ncbi:MAG: YidC/Oxa1 family membrane protein insertase [Candidatus Spechtbacterales bacterium]
MDFLIGLFNSLIFEPLLNFLIVVVNFVPGHALGPAIVLVTVIIRLILYPLSHKALISQRKLFALQPEVKKIQEKLKDNKQEQSKVIMELYKKEKINPLAGCVPFLIQIPFIFGLYRVFLFELTPDNLPPLYSLVSMPESISTVFLGISLSQPSVILALLAAVSQFFLSKFMFSRRKNMGLSSGKKNDLQSMMGKQMTYVLPVVTFFIAQSFPAGLALYWVTTTLFSFGEQYIINRKIS